MPLISLEVPEIKFDNEIDPKPPTGEASGVYVYQQKGDSPLANLTLQYRPGDSKADDEWKDLSAVQISTIDGDGKDTISWQFGSLGKGFYDFRVLGQSLTEKGEPEGEPVATKIIADDQFMCFLSGTLIATPQGAVAVEALRIGDLVLTADGRAVPVLWLGRQVIATVFGLRDTDHPVTIRSGALGEGLPARDLRVTAGHAMLIDGVLANAAALVNGTTIARISPAELGDRFTVYHIETEHHEIVLAEGAASETFVDNVTRARFDNFREYLAIFGAEGRAMEERPEPRAMSERQVPPAIRARIAARAAALSAGVAAAA